MATGTFEQGTSQNGWPAYTQGYSTALSILPWITGRIRSGDVTTIFNWLCQQFNDKVEPIKREASWGWAYRPIGGTTTVSNHGSGTAMDLNAPEHPQGKAGTFTSSQLTELRQILNKLGDVVRWGGDYNNSKDEMHFEINVGPDDPRVAALAQKILAGTIDGNVSEPIPSVDFEAIKSGFVAEVTKIVDERISQVLARFSPLATSSQVTQVAENIYSQIQQMWNDREDSDDVVMVTHFNNITASLAALQEAVEQVKAQQSKPATINVQYTPVQDEPLD